MKTQSSKEALSLEIAIDRLDISYIEEFLATQPDLNELTDSNTLPILHHVVMKGNSRLLELFLSYAKSNPLKADIQIKDDYGCNLIMQAAYLSNPEPIIKILLKKGVDIHNQSISGETPLHELCRNNEIGAAELLLKNGVNPDIAMPIDPNQNLENVTPAHYAAMYKNLGMIKLLARYGADFDIKFNYLSEEGEALGEGNAQELYGSSPQGVVTFTQAVQEAKAQSAEKDSNADVDERAADHTTKENDQTKSSNLQNSYSDISKGISSLKIKNTENKNSIVSDNETKNSVNQHSSLNLDNLIAWLYDLPKIMQKPILNSAPIQSIITSIKSTSLIYDKSLSFSFSYYEESDYLSEDEEMFSYKEVAMNQELSYKEVAMNQELSYTGLVNNSMITDNSVYNNFLYINHI